MNSDAKDIIRQDLKIAQQFIKHLAGSKDRVQFNVINVGQVRVDSSFTSKDLREMLEFVLERLPEPRLDALNDMAYEVALSKFSTTTQAAHWLGRTYRCLTSKKRKLAEGFEARKEQAKITDGSEEA